jgi:hypothetical protein
MLCGICNVPMAGYGDVTKCNICGLQLTPKGITSGKLRPPLADPVPMVPVASEEKSPQWPCKRYRSEMKRKIRAILLDQPLLTDLEVCRRLDEEGINLPKKLRSLERGFESAYNKMTLKGRLATAISKVRRDMRKTGTL